MANLDDDAELEIVVGDFGGQLHFWGTPAPVFHLFLPGVMVGHASSVKQCCEEEATFRLFLPSVMIGAPITQ